jgi:AcrR family transcriptional regulator
MPKPRSTAEAATDLVAAPARRRVRRGSVEDAQQLREELLAAAMGLFAGGGLDAVTMRAVAEQVGVSVMTPYRYFADKAELLRGLWQSVLRAACDEMRTAVEAQRGGRARQRAMIEAFVGYWEANPDHYRLVYQTDKVTQSTPKAGLTEVPVYGELLQLVQGVTVDVAHEIGAGTAHVKLAGDIRFAMMLGYLQAALVNRRYPWSDAALLRRTYIDQVMSAVERVLLTGATAEQS